MNAVTRLEADDAAGLFHRFGLGDLIRLDLAANGVENSNYFATLRLTDGRERQVVLTLLEQPSYAGRRPFVDLLDACVRAGLPVPRLYRNQSGSVFDECGGKPALVCSRLLGQHVLNPTQLQIAAIGRFLARLHQASQPMTSLLPRYPRDTQWLRESLTTIQTRTPYGETALIGQGLTATESLLRRSDAQALPRSGIHGDLFRDNALFNSHGLTGVLDFHHASAGYCLYDRAVVANDWCTDSQGWLDPDRTQTLLRAYNETRALTSAEVWLFPAFCLYAATAFYLSRARARVLGTGRVKDPQEFQRILSRHLHSPLYLDERMLNLNVA